MKVIKKPKVKPEMMSPTELIAYVKELEKENKELKEQIEEMKEYEKECTYKILLGVENDNKFYG